MESLSLSIILNKSMKQRNRFYLTLLIFLLLGLCSGCRTGSLDLPFYDPVTYKNLTDLKPEVFELYDTFSNPSADPKTIGSIRLKLSQIYEYENGKGSKNQETLNQITKVRQMFARHVSEKKDGKPWSDVFKADKIENIGKAFDIAIHSETLKNKAEDLK
jgi:hypothetical protein